MITIRDWLPGIPPEDRCVAYVGEHETVKRRFLVTGPDWSTYAAWSFHLDLAFDLTSVTTREHWEQETTQVNRSENMTETSGSSVATTTKEKRAVTEETVQPVL